MDVQADVKHEVSFKWPNTKIPSDEGSLIMPHLRLLKS